MGLFDSACAESGLVIDSKQRLIPIVEIAPGSWMPFALPIAGTNDRGGTMDVPSKLDANEKRLLALGKKFDYADEDAEIEDLESVLDEIRGDGSGATWDDRAVSFALIDGGIFDAIVKAVTANGATAWTRYAQLALGKPAPPLPNRGKPKKEKAKPVDPTTKRLCEAILAAPDDAAPRKVFVDHLLERDDPRGQLLSVLPVLGKLALDKLAALALADPEAYGAAQRPALVEAVRFLAWGTPLVPAHGEGQFFGYAGKDDGYTQPYCDRARKLYEGMPELLAAVEANAKAWRSRGE